ncbi:MAG: Gfo/Idh/MocA family oxidoreductase [Planctomycetota bacterium]
MKTNQNSDRRSFLRVSTAGAVAASIGGAVSEVKGGYHHGVDDKLRIGLVGCGGRGTQAVFNALKADPNTEVTALADAFEDRVQICYENLQGNPVADGRVNISKDRMFVGFGCCDQLIESGVDVVLLATPPYFRPAHLRAAVEAGKHVFCEKPVAVDPPGVRHVLESCEMAHEKGLSVVSGFCWRYDIGVNAVMSKILDEKAIGEIHTIQENYLTGTLWHRGQKPEWSEMEYQMRNWLYFNWLSGDHITEQHIHSLDKALWLMEDKPPVKAYGSGGRLARTDNKWGNIYDHFSTVFEWENGVKMFSFCRQMANCMTDVDDYVFGTEGSAKVLRKRIYKDNEVTWKFPKQKTPSMYDVEHQHLFKSIRENQPINNGKYMSYSTMLAIMGREASYTGKLIKWDDLMQSDQKLGPEKLEFGDFTPHPIAIPGTDF